MQFLAQWFLTQEKTHQSVDPYLPLQHSETAYLHLAVVVQSKEVVVVNIVAKTKIEKKRESFCTGTENV